MHFALLPGELGTTAPVVWAWFASAWEIFAQSTGAMLATSIWQGALIVCGFEIATRLMPRVSAAHRFAIWAAGFGAAATLPLLSLLHFGQDPAGTSAITGAAGSSTGALFQIDARWGLVIAGFWAVASLLRAADLTAHSVKLRRLWKAALPVDAGDSLYAAVRDLRGGRVMICTTNRLDRPSVIGFLAPKILIPDWLITRATPRELEQIILHEAEHLHRRDDWTNLLQKICLVAFPLNPMLAWIEHRLCGEREMACDEGVVRITNAPRAHAACLASLAERGLERRAEALSLGAWHRRSELVHRVHRILLYKRSMSRAAAAGLLGALGCMLIAGSVEMARCPQLVAFVPRQNSLAMTPERQQQLDALLARENAESRMMLPPNYQAVQARAVLPDAQRPTLPGAFKPERKCSRNARQKSGATSTEKMAKAVQAGDRVNPDGNQQWVVLAAWEEVQTVSRLPQPVADYDTTSESAGTATQKSGSTESPISSGKTTPAGQARSGASQNSGERADQYTITRLILRVMPATGSSQPASNGGWLVFQL